MLRLFFIAHLILGSHFIPVLGARPGVQFFPVAYKTTHFDDAQVDCQIIGGDLVKVTTAEENQEIADFMFAWSADEVFLGADDRTEDGSFVWRDGSAADITIPADSHFDNAWLGEGCLAMHNDGGVYKWVDRKCGDNKYFVCQVETASPEAVAAADIRACWVANGLLIPEPGAVPMECKPRDRQYFAPHTKGLKVPRDEARTICQEFQGNADLAMVTTDAEYEMIKRMKRVYDYDNDRIYLGGKRLAGSTDWKWPNNSVYTWPTIENNPGISNDGCLCVVSNEDFEDKPCTQNERFICERDISVQRNINDICYWIKSGLKLRSEIPAECAAFDSSMSMITSAMEYRKVMPALREEEYFIGLESEGTSDKYRWMKDGSPLTWSFWDAGEPDGGDDCIGPNTANSRWHDYWCTDTRNILCEKDVSLVPSNHVLLRKSIIMNEVIYRPEAGYMFSDTTVEKKYSCNSADVYQAFLDSLSLVAEITIKEIPFEDYSPINKYDMFDTDSTSCVDLSAAWTYLPITTLQLVHGGTSPFSIAISLAASVTEKAKKHIVVSTETSPGPPILKHKKCKKLSSADPLMYECDCVPDCNVSIRVFALTLAEGIRNPPTICTITKS